MTPADRLVLDALHQDARNWLTPAQWQEVEDAVEKAGGVLYVDEFTRGIIQKAARQSFGGNRSAAGAYAAHMRWRGSNSGGIEAAQQQARERALSTHGGKGGQDEEFDGSYASTAKEGAAASKAVSGKDAAMVDKANKLVAESQDHDSKGKKMDAWMAAEQAHGLTAQLTENENAPSALQRFHGAVKALVLRLTDKFYE